jgi:hypothetical protein
VSKLSKPTVELQSGARPSRIRRDPPPPVEQKSVRAYPTEREIFFTVLGVILFALAVVIITFGVSDFTSH